MAVASHEGSLVSFPGLSGFFTHTLGVVAGSAVGSVASSPASVLNYGTPFANLPGSASGIILAQGIQSVAFTQNVNAEPLAVIGHTGQAGWGKRAGSVDITIEAVLTSGYPLGKKLTDYENELPENMGQFTIDTTDGATTSAVGRRGIASGLFVNSLTFTFTQNANATLSVGLTGDGVRWIPLTAPQGMDTDVEHTPVTWDTVDLSNPTAGLIRLSGVQTATFAATMTRDDVFEIGTFDPIERPSQKPHNVTVSLEGLANSVVIQSWLDKFVSEFDTTNSANLVTAKVRRQGDKTNDWIVASGLRPTTAALNVATGANSTLNLSFTGTSLEF